MAGQKERITVSTRWGGAPQELLYDRMKTAVIREDGRAGRS